MIRDPNMLYKVYDYFEKKAPVLFFILTEKGRIVEANRYAETLTGIKINGLHDLLVNFTDGYDLEKILRDAHCEHLMHIRARSGQAQSFCFSFQPLNDHILAFGRQDVVESELMRQDVLSLNQELNNLMRQLHKQNAQLQRLNREKNQFLGMAAHDLRKPTGLILTYAEFLLEDTAGILESEHLWQMERIRSAAVRMQALIDDFLDVSLIESGKLSLTVGRTSLIELIDSARLMIDRSAEKRNIRFHLDLDYSTGRLLVDGPKIEQVLINLLSNAVNHSPDGGQVIIGSWRSPAGLRIWIEDEGSGLSADQKKRLFEAFSCQSPRKPDGERSIGLGLVIAKKIVEAHGGQLQADCASGKGAVFEFTLPPSCLTAI